MPPFPALYDRYAAAVWNKDVAAFMALFAPDAHQFDMWGTWLQAGTAEIQPGVAGWFGSLGTDRVRVTFDPVRSEVAGDLAYGESFVRFAALAPDGQELRAMDNRFTFVARKTQGQWQICHAHSSAPLDDSAQAIFQR